MITAPATGNVRTIVMGVNNDQITEEDDILSTASCTANSIAPVLYLLDKEYVVLNRVSWHRACIYTMDQMLQDGPHRFRTGTCCHTIHYPTAQVLPSHW